jgi:hypothetical protein
VKATGYFENIVSIRNDYHSLIMNIIKFGDGHWLINLNPIYFEIAKALLQTSLQAKCPKN